MSVFGTSGAGDSAGRDDGWYHSASGGLDRSPASPFPQTDGMQAILGGLGAAFLWAGATLASSRSSRMLGSWVVLGWIMLVGLVVGLPIGIVSGVPTDLSPGTAGLLLLAGLSYAGGLGSAYKALTLGKISIVAPITATEGAVAAIIAVALGAELAAGAAILLAIVAIGVVLSAMEPARPEIPAGSTELELDAEPDAGRATAGSRADHPTRAAGFAVLAAIVFAVGLVATGKAAQDLPPLWVAIAVRAVGVVVVVIPLMLRRRLTVTRAALPLVVFSGIGELFGTSLLAWGASADIAIAAVLGSQFAAIAAVLAFVLFGERLSRIQVVGVVLIVVGVTALALIST